MRVVFTEGAVRDLDEIRAYVEENFPGALSAVEERVRTVSERIGAFPGIGQPVPQRPGLRAVLLLPFPYRLFYRVVGEKVEIVRLRHTARQN